MLETTQTIFGDSNLNDSKESKPDHHIDVAPVVKELIELSIRRLIEPTGYDDANKTSSAFKVFVWHDEILKPTADQVGILLSHRILIFTNNDAKEVIEFYLYTDRDLKQSGEICCTCGFGLKTEHDIQRFISPFPVETKYCYRKSLHKNLCVATTSGLLDDYIALYKLLDKHILNKEMTGDAVIIFLYFFIKNTSICGAAWSPNVIDGICLLGNKLGVEDKFTKLVASFLKNGRVDIKKDIISNFPIIEQLKLQRSIITEKISKIIKEACWRKFDGLAKKIVSNLKMGTNNERSLNDQLQFSKVKIYFIESSRQLLSKTIQQTASKMYSNNEGVTCNKENNARCCM